MSDYLNIWYLLGVFLLSIFSFYFWPVLICLQVWLFLLNAGPCIWKLQRSFKVLNNEIFLQKGFILILAGISHNGRSVTLFVNVADSKLSFHKGWFLILRTRAPAESLECLPGLSSLVCWLPTHSSAFQAVRKYQMWTSLVDQVLHLSHWDGNSKTAYSFSSGCIDFASYIRNSSGYLLKTAAYMHQKLGAG